MSRTESLEIERKYDVADLVRVPDLAGVGPIDRTVVEEPFTLRAVYVDTADHVLSAHRITLRRREGGHDAGWHLKLPAGHGARREVHAPLGSDPGEDVPASLRRLVEVVLRGRPVHPVLVLTTTRTLTRLQGGDGEPLAELADDEVTAADPDTSTVRSWREWEVELAPGVERTDGEALFDHVSGVLESAGASPSSSASKLARGLGDRLPKPVELAPAAVEFGSAAEFVYDTVGALTAQLVALDPAARDDEPDAVHRYRTTVRRIRSVLRVFTGVLSADDEAFFADTLRSLGRTAGVVRDLEVRAELLDHYADVAPDGFVPHEAIARMRATLTESTRDARADLERFVDSALYFELLDRLEALPYAEPSGDHADDDSDEFVVDALRRAGKRTHRRVRTAVSAVSGAGGVQHDTLHSARKSARRLRYALDAAKAAGVKGTGSARKSAHRLQDHLGDVLDAEGIVAFVVSAADTARWAEEDTFAYGVLATLAESDRRSSLAGLKQAAKGI